MCQAIKITQNAVYVVLKIGAYINDTMILGMMGAMQSWMMGHANISVQIYCVAQSSGVDLHPKRLLLQMSNSTSSSIINFTVSATSDATLTSPALGHILSAAINSGALVFENVPPIQNVSCMTNAAESCGTPSCTTPASTGNIVQISTSTIIAVVVVGVGVLILVAVVVAIALWLKGYTWEQLCDLIRPKPFSNVVHPCDSNESRYGPDKLV